MSGMQALNELSASCIFDLTGLVAVVSGGGTGIGHTIATTLLANNAKRVFILGIDLERLESVGRAWNGQGTKGELVPVQCDVADKDSVLAAVKTVAKREEYVNVVFSNAGIHGTQTHQPETLDPQAYQDAYSTLTNEDFEKTFSINTYGAYHVATHFINMLAAVKEKAPDSAKRFTAQIIFTTSMNSHSKSMPTGGYSIVYMASKAATAHIAKILAAELHPLGIRVNSIAPGHTSTSMAGPQLDELGRSGLVSINDTKLFKIPLRDKHYVLKQGASFLDIGSLALALVANQFITGEAVLIDGGTLLEFLASECFTAKSATGLNGRQ